MSKNDGGPAFPAYDGFDRFPGISARDYFAAAALTGEIASDRVATEEQLAAFAYKMADAMLAEREKGK